MEGGRRVRALAPEVAAQIASAAYIQSLTHAIEEVVANSVDAEAAVVRVWVNWETQSFVVEDDGWGISREDFKKVGLVHCTSKGASRSSLGFRGAALYALARVARVQIESTTATQSSRSSKELLDGCVTDTTSNPVSGAAQGTTARVWGLWDRYPVRRRVALETRASKALTQIRERLLKLLIPFPWIQCTLYSSPDGELLMHLSKNRSWNCTLEYLFGELVDSMVPLEIEWGDVCVQGCVGMPLVENVNPRLQWLYVNRRPVVSDMITSVVAEMYRVAGRLLNSSWQQQLMRPVYVLNLDLDPNAFDISSEPEKSRVVFRNDREFMAAVKRGFMAAWKGSLSLAQWERLNQNAFLESMSTDSQLPDEAVETDSGVEHSVEASDLALAKQRKRTSVWMPIMASKPRRTCFDASKENPPSLSSGRILATEDDSQLRDLSPAGSEAASPESDRGSIERTEGECCPLQDLSNIRPAKEAEGSYSSIPGDAAVLSAPPFYRPIRRGVHRNPAISMKSETAQDICSIMNPTEPLTGPAIKDLPAAIPLEIKRYHSTPLHSRKILTVETDEKEWTWSFDQRREPAIADFSHQLSPTTILDRTVLQEPDIIGTIDHKFILIQRANQILAVDQHAADERVKLEQMQSKVKRDLENSVLQQRLPTPQYITLSPREQEVLRDNWGSICRWGWNGVMDWQSHVLKLSHHPSILDTHFSSTDLKVYLHALDEAAEAVLYPPCVDRLLKSKACRTAVMFGDPLTLEQQKTLLRNLSHTQLCFMCAHGRPTVVPVTNLTLFHSETHL